MSRKIAISIFVVGALIFLGGATFAQRDIRVDRFSDSDIDRIVTGKSLTRDEETFVRDILREKTPVIKATVEGEGVVVDDSARQKIVDLYLNSLTKLGDPMIDVTEKNLYNRIHNQASRL